MKTLEEWKRTDVSRRYDRHDAVYEGEDEYYEQRRRPAEDDAGIGAASLPA